MADSLATMQAASSVQKNRLLVYASYKCYSVVKPFYTLMRDISCYKMAHKSCIPSDVKLV